MSHTDKKKSAETSDCATPKPQPVFSPPVISPELALKWGLALLGKENAVEYLAWLQTRMNNDSR